VLLLLPQGMAVLLSGYWLPSLLWASLPFAILTSLLLYINQFPDREADRLAGKWHWVVRLPLAQARAGYGLLVVLAYGVLAMLLWRQLLPLSAALGC
jgi:1,4-dihydroxy-2-naphthoate octaprenyltransferase